MAEEDVHKQEFVLRNLHTRSVTLYPTKAQIVRDIQGVTLKPGANQITIEGLTPTVDEHSIKVEGTGAATITDLSVQLVANKEFYEDIYPSDDEDEEDLDDDDDVSEKEDESTKSINVEIQNLGAQSSAAQEEEASANARLALLDKYGETLTKNRPENLEKFLQEHRTERAKAFVVLTTARAKDAGLRKQIASLHRKAARLSKVATKEKEKANRQKQKKLTMQERKREEARLERARVKAERVKFWPKKVYNVVISLDAPSGATPGSSRRGSVEDLVKIAAPTETQSETSTVGDINLSLSYITYSASWSPRYDLSLNSVTSSGILDYCAELKNTTSETWRDAKVVLSTSQTSYQGLGDTIPVMQPWNVRLVKGIFGKGYVKNASNALYSQHEQDQKAKNRNEIPAQVFAPRSELFGLGSNGSGYANFSRHAPAQAYSVQANQPQNQLYQTQRGMYETTISTRTQVRPVFGAPSLFGSLANQDNVGGSLFEVAGPQKRAVGFGRAATDGASAPVAASSLFGSSAIANSGPQDNPPTAFNSASTGANPFGTVNYEMLPQQMAPAQMGPQTVVQSAAQHRLPAQPSAARPTHLQEITRGGAPGGGGGWGTEDLLSLGGAAEAGQEEFEAFDADTIAPQDPALLFEESSFSDSGLTTTYDVPTLKTLSPTSSTIKHKIARIEFKSIIFSHILIPKLKAAAYLKAKLRNASKIALLKGPAGLTLDGSFLGQSSIPRCSSGESFVLPLGVDPTISVSYAKPTVRRSQSGIFNKEDCEVFTRLATVTNTKANAAVDLLVLDQVPVSEDERLRIEIASPRGLRPGGDSIPAGHGLTIGSAAGVAAVDVASDTESLSGGKSAASKSRLSIYGDNGAKGSGTGTAKEALRWGSATATAKKDGEVNWNVKINPLRGCKLVLEYEATYPNGEMVQGMN